MDFEAVLNARLGTSFENQKPLFMKNIIQLSAIICLFCSVLFDANATTQQPAPASVEHDSTTFAKVVIYRADNPLTRKYKLESNLNGAFTLEKKESKTIDASSQVFEVAVKAFWHTPKRYFFALSNGKTHYFRVHDRNSYSELAPFLEVIEVTEDTYKRDLRR